MKKKLLVVFHLCVFSWAINISAESPENIIKCQTITLSDISREPIKKIRRFQPLANYLAENLKEYGIEQGKVRIAPDLETLASWTDNNEIDIYLDSVYPAVQLIERTGAIPILRRWKNALEEYHSVFFTLRENKISSLKDLKGKTLALENEFSTTGFMMPVLEILKNNLIISKEGYEDNGNEDIKYIFAKEDNNIIQWVIKGKTDAGVVDNHSFKKIPPTSQEYIKEIKKTPSITRQLVVVRKTMDPDLIKRIQKLLLNLDKTKEGRLILNRLKDTKKFDLINKELLLEIERIKKQVPILEEIK